MRPSYLLITTPDQGKPTHSMKWNGWIYNCMQESTLKLLLIFMATRADTIKRGREKGRLYQLVLPVKQKQEKQPPSLTPIADSNCNWHP